MRVRRAFTLVELLVVIAIIALLLAILLPAVQSAREAARRIQCANNFKQVALATLNYASTNEHLPAVLDPRHDQEASWRYTILPFLEEPAIYDELSDASKWWLVQVERTSTPMKPAIVPAYSCPSTPGNPRFGVAAQVVFRDAAGIDNSRIIFDAVSVQDIFAVWWVYSADTVGPYAGAWSGQETARDGDGLGIDEKLRKPAKLIWMTDGTSKTILIRDVVGFPGWIYGQEVSQTQIGDHMQWLRGFAGDMELDLRHQSKPAINYTNVNGVYGFHPNGAHVAMCDGSVRFIPEDISYDAVFALTTRANSDVIDTLPQRPERSVFLSSWRRQPR